MSLRFKVDENLPEDIPTLLQRSGWDAHSVYDEKLQGAEDATVADACKREKRVIVTLDRGFGNILAYPPSQYCGIILLRPKKQSRKSVVTLMEIVTSKLRTDSVTGQLWIVENEQIRVRGW